MKNIERPKRVMNYESTSLCFLQYVDKLEAYANNLEEVIAVNGCSLQLKEKNAEISELAKTFINEVDKKHPFVNLPEEEDFYMARHKLSEKLT